MNLVKVQACLVLAAVDSVRVAHLQRPPAFQQGR